jgi:hypothetical protein
MLDGDPHQARPEDLEHFRQAVLSLRGELLSDQQLGERLLKGYNEQLEREAGGR